MRARPLPTSSSTGPRGPRWPARPRTRSRPTRSTRLRGLGDALDLARGRAGLPPAVPPAVAVRRLGRPPAPRAGGVPAPAAAAAHAVRDRPRRLGGGRQVHHRAACCSRCSRTGPSTPTSRWSPPTASCYPNAELERRGHPAPQGLPGVLRPQGAAALRHRHQVRQRRGRGADLLPPRLRRGPRREGRGQAPRHRHHRGPQRPPAGPGPRRRPHRPGGQRLLRLLASTSTPPPATSSAGTSSGSCGCARRPSATRRPTSASTPRSPRTRPSPRPTRIWDAINGPNLVENVAPTRARATLVLRKDADHSVRYVRLRKL